MQSAHRAVLKKQLSLDEMRAVFPLLRLARAERVYCDIVELLAKLKIDPEAEPTTRETLKQLNKLLEAGRLIAEKRKALLPLLGSNVITELEKEFGEMGRRLDEARDPLLRHQLEQALEMCSNRLENTRAFETGLARLTAQEDTLVHTLLSAETALARMQLVPEMGTPHAAMEIAAAVAEMTRSTYNAEKAVEEVARLSH